MKLKKLPLLVLLISSGHAAVDDYEKYKAIGARCMAHLASAGRRGTSFPKEEFKSLVGDACIWKYNGEVVAEGVNAVKEILTANIQRAGGSWRVTPCQQFVDSTKPACLITFTITGKEILHHIVNVALWINRETEKVDLIHEVRGVVSQKALHEIPKKSVLIGNAKKKKGLMAMFQGLNKNKSKA